MEGPSFDRILTAARRGDVEAFAKLWRKYAAGVAGYLRLQGADDPESLTSEVFLGVHRQLDTFSGDEVRFRAWLYTIAHHRLIDDRRRMGRRLAVAPASLASSVSEGPADHGSLEDQVVARLQADRVRRFCDSLADSQRDVLLLRLLGGLTIEEVSVQLNKTVGAVKALQRRGLAVLRQSLDIDPESEGVPL